MKSEALCLLTRLLYWLGLRPKYQRATKKKILIVSTTGLGDTLWATPALRALAESDLVEEISVLTTSFGKEVLAGNPHLSEVFVLPRPFFPLCVSLLCKLRKKKFDTVLLFHASQRLTFPLAALTGAKELIGYAGEVKGCDSLFSSLLPKVKEHEIKKRLALAIKAGAKPELFPLDYRFARRSREELSLPPNSPLVALHPGAKNLFKQWPVSSFVEVGKKLGELFSVTLVVTGSPEEKKLVHAVADQIEGAIPFCEKKDLSSLGSLLSEVELFITNDTGPMHMAFALQTPTIALFAPTSPELCGPIGGNHWKIIAKSRTCTPCLRKKCLLPFCMRQIAPAQVLEAAIAFLRR